MWTKEKGSMHALSVYSYWMPGPHGSKQRGIIVRGYFWKIQAEVSGIRAEILYLFNTRSDFLKHKQYKKNIPKFTPWFQTAQILTLFWTQTSKIFSQFQRKGWKNRTLRATKPIKPIYGSITKLYGHSRTDPTREFSLLYIFSNCYQSVSRLNGFTDFCFRFYRYWFCVWASFQTRVNSEVWRNADRWLCPRSYQTARRQGKILSYSYGIGERRNQPRSLSLSLRYL